jgi:hypothetical protein
MDDRIIAKTRCGEGRGDLLEEHVEASAASGSK